jgi:kynurenine formamidase
MSKRKRAGGAGRRPGASSTTLSQLTIDAMADELNHRRRRPRLAQPSTGVGGTFLRGAGRYGLTQLANLAQLPPTGAVDVVAPLKLVWGTGSPARVLALVPRG